MLFFPLQIRTYNTRWASLVYMCGSKSSAVNDLSLRRVEFLLDFMPIWEAAYLGRLSQRLEANVFFLGQPIFYICILQTFSLDSVAYFFFLFVGLFDSVIFVGLILFVGCSFIHSLNTYSLNYPPVFLLCWALCGVMRFYLLPLLPHSAQHRAGKKGREGNPCWESIRASAVIEAGTEREKQRKYCSSHLLRSLLTDLVGKWY